MTTFKEQAGSLAKNHPFSEEEPIRSGYAVWSSPLHEIEFVPRLTRDDRNVEVCIYEQEGGEMSFTMDRSSLDDLIERLKKLRAWVG